MPVEITKYLCQFKCGTRAKGTIQQAKIHEATCWKNPERRACSTCKHEVYHYDSCPHPELDGNPIEEWMFRDCKKIDCEEFDRLFTLSGYHNKPAFHIQPVHSCPHWEQKQLQTK